MRINSSFPDYELADRVEVTSPSEIRAMVDPVRATILDLLLERAATVTELAAALDRPKSTVAHHVSVLVKANMLRVVRTRRVRAIEERFYGRTARVFAMGVLNLPGPPTWKNELGVAAAESTAAHDADRLYTLLRHARVPRKQAKQFWRRVEALFREFGDLPRGGDEVYGLVVGLYPTDRPTLPNAVADAE